MVHSTQTLEAVDAMASDVGSLATRLRPAIEAHRAEAETTRRLPPDLVEVLRGAGAFRLSTPRERGGFEAPLAAALEVYEAFGRIDGPVAWNIWNVGENSLWNWPLPANAISHFSSGNVRTGE